MPTVNSAKPSVTATNVRCSSRSRLPRFGPGDGGLVAQAAADDQVHRARPPRRPRTRPPRRTRSRGAPTTRCCRRTRAAWSAEHRRADQQQDHDRHDEPVEPAQRPVRCTYSTNSASSRPSQISASKLSSSGSQLPRPAECQTSTPSRDEDAGVPARLGGDAEGVAVPPDARQRQPAAGREQRDRDDEQGELSGGGLSHGAGSSGNLRGQPVAQRVDAAVGRGRPAPRPWPGRGRPAGGGASGRSLCARRSSAAAPASPRPSRDQRWSQRSAMPSRISAASAGLPAETVTVTADSCRACGRRRSRPARRRRVRAVHEHAAAPRVAHDRGVHGRVVGRGEHEAGAVEVSRLVPPVTRSTSRGHARIERRARRTARASRRTRSAPPPSAPPPPRRRR